MRSTHEDHIHNVRAAVAARLNEDAARSKILSAKLVYGSGKPGVRGVCFYQSWETAAAVELIEICASGEESLLQLAGTTIHELAHCLAGPDRWSWEALGERSKDIRTEECPGCRSTILTC